MAKFVVEFGKPANPAEPDDRLDAPAFHRNHDAIWSAIAGTLGQTTGDVLEIGSGTGQHAAAFAAQAPALTWWPSDIYPSHLASIAAWCRHAGLANLRAPQRIDLTDPAWTWAADGQTGGELAAMVCINVLHISPWNVSENLMAGAGRLLRAGGRLFIYGPFMRDGKHTTSSNNDFDASLRAENPAWGVRDVADLNFCARAAGLTAADITAMPANNLVLAFTRRLRQNYSITTMTKDVSMSPEPIYDIAHLGHVEVLTPKFDASLKFFIDVMGMTQSGAKGDSAYLRGWDDYERYSLKLTASKTSGMGHAAFRTRSAQALDRRVAALKGSGFEVGWTEGDLGHGKSYMCKDPDGHNIELYYETEWYDPPPDQKPALKNQAQRYPARGCNVRRIDHFNGLAVDVKANREFFQNYLGFMLTEQIVLDDGTEAGMWLTATNKSYDFAYTRDHTGTKGRFHHITYALDSREDVLRAADIFLENGVFIETGPHKHAIQQTFFLYVYEPGGNRIEVACPGAHLVLAPDWKPIRWTEAERKKGQAWGLQTIESFHTHGTPPVAHKK